MTKTLYDRKYFGASHKFQRNKRRLEILVDMVMTYNPKSVLDVGCGIGFLVNELAKTGIVVSGCDFASDLVSYWQNDAKFTVSDAKQLPYESQSFDLVVSSDFFEHIDDEDIDQVAKEMKRVGKRVVTFVADDKGQTLTKRQAMYHVSHHPLDWWKNRLKGIEVVSSHDVRV